MDSTTEVRGTNLLPSSCRASRRHQQSRPGSWPAYRGGCAHQLLRSWVVGSTAACFSKAPLTCCTAAHVFGLSHLLLVLLLHVLGLLILHDQQQTGVRLTWASHADQPKASRPGDAPGVHCNCMRSERSAHDNAQDNAVKEQLGYAYHIRLVDRPRGCRVYAKR